MSSASTSEARGFAGDRSGRTIRAMLAPLVVLKTSSPLRASNVAPPQLAPPMVPGLITVPSIDGGV